MKCEQCKAPATVHLTTSAGGTPLVVHLCERCADAIKELRHPRVLKAIGASQAFAAQAVGTEPPPVCEGCGTIPTVHVTKSHLGERREHHLCETCFLDQLSDPREKAYHYERFKEPQYMVELDRVMAEVRSWPSKRPRKD